MDSLRRRHNDRDSVSNHQPHDCLLNRLFRRRSKKTSKLRVTGLCAVNSPGTGEFPAQMASNAENVSIWWRHHVTGVVRHLYDVTAMTFASCNSSLICAVANRMSQDNCSLRMFHASNCMTFSRCLVLLQRPLGWSVWESIQKSHRKKEETDPKCCAMREILGNSKSFHRSANHNSA